MNSPRKLAVGLLAAMAIIVILTIIATFMTPTHTNGHPRHTSPSNTPNTVATAPPTKGGLDPNVDYGDTGSPPLENEKFHNDTIATADQKPSENIEEIIRRTNANLEAEGLPVLSKQEECLARAVANRTDRQACNGI